MSEQGKNELNFIQKRHSVRKFKDTPVPTQDLEHILTAATQAPSGKNHQNWHFVVVRNVKVIASIVAAVENKNAQLAELLVDEAKRRVFKASVTYHTVFKGAPALVLVYAGHYPTPADDLAEAGLISAEELVAFRRPNPGIQNIAAAMENLLLAAANLGYGTCWMTGPTYAGKEISELVGFAREGWYLGALTPLGIPADDAGKGPARKPLSEVVTWVE